MTKSRASLLALIGVGLLAAGTGAEAKTFWYMGSFCGPETQTTTDLPLVTKGISTIWKGTSTKRFTCPVIQDLVSETGGALYNTAANISVNSYTPTTCVREFTTTGNGGSDYSSLTMTATVPALSPAAVSFSYKNSAGATVTSVYFGNGGTYQRNRIYCDLPSGGTQQAEHDGCRRTGNVAHRS